MEKNALCGVFYFMSFSVTVGQTSHNPSPFFTFSVEPHDLNNETPVFCLLAVFLYITVAQEECLDHQSLSQRTLLHTGDGDGFWMDFIFFFFFFFPSNVTLIESQDWCSGFFFFSLSASSRFDMAHHVKVSFNKKTSILERKRNIYFLTPTAQIDLKKVKTDKMKAKYPYMQLADKTLAGFTLQSSA